MITIEITGKPVPWSRTEGNGKRRYNKSEMSAWKTFAGLKANTAMAGRKPLAGPLMLHYTAIYEIPKSWPKWRKQAAKAGYIAMTPKPDLDNLVKCTKDAFNKIVYVDDALVTKGFIHKKYGPVAMVVAKIIPVDQLPATCTQADLKAFLETEKVA